MIAVVFNLPTCKNLSRILMKCQNSISLMAFPCGCLNHIFLERSAYEENTKNSRTNQIQMKEVRSKRIPRDLFVKVTMKIDSNGLVWWSGLVFIYRSCRTRNHSFCQVLKLSSSLLLYLNPFKKSS